MLTLLIAILVANSHSAAALTPPPANTSPAGTASVDPGTTTVNTSSPVASPAEMDAFDFHAADVGLLQNKVIQEELGITDAMRSQMNKFADQHRAGLKAYEEQLKKDKKDPSKVGLTDPKIQELFMQLKRNVLGLLSPAQLKRLRELSLQRVGLVGLLDDKVASKLGISSSTVEKMRGYYAEGAQKAQKLEAEALKPIYDEYKDKKASSDEEKKKLQQEVQQKVQEAQKKFQPQVKAIQEETRKKILGAISKKQQDQYVALQGKPLKTKG